MIWNKRGSFIWSSKPDTDSPNDSSHEDASIGDFIDLSEASPSTSWPNLEPAAPQPTLRFDDTFPTEWDCLAPLDFLELQGPFMSPAPPSIQTNEKLPLLAWNLNTMCVSAIGMLKDKLPKPHERKSKSSQSSAFSPRTSILRLGYGFLFPSKPHQIPPQISQRRESLTWGMCFATQ